MAYDYTYIYIKYICITDSSTSIDNPTWSIAYVRKLSRSSFSVRIRVHWICISRRFEKV